MSDRRRVAVGQGGPKNWQVDEPDQGYEKLFKHDCPCKRQPSQGNMKAGVPFAQAVTMKGVVTSIRDQFSAPSEGLLDEHPGLERPPCCR